MNILPKITPIYQTSVFKFEDLDAVQQYFDEPGSRYLYSRNGNPNSDELAEAVNQLEGGAGAVATGSGMAAIFAALAVYCQAGDHVLCAADIYGGSSALINAELSRMGITVTYVPFEQLTMTSSRGLSKANTSNPWMVTVRFWRSTSIPWWASL